MKRMIIVVLAALIAGLAVLFFNASLIDASFATSATLKYHYDGKTIDATVTDDDLKELKAILRGYSYGDKISKPACFFTSDISITMADGQKRITFCPACDEDPIICINDSNRYINISKQKREKLDKIAAKYDIIFH